MTPLHYAAKYAKIEAAQVLIENGADPSIPGDDGCLPLHFAVKYRPDVVRSSSESDPEKITAETPEENEDESPKERVLSFSEDAFIETLRYLIDESIAFQGLVQHTVLAQFYVN